MCWCSSVPPSPARLQAACLAVVCVFFLIWRVVVLSREREIEDPYVVRYYKGVCCHGVVWGDSPLSTHLVGVECKAPIQ